MLAGKLLTYPAANTIELLMTDFHYLHLVALLVQVGHVIQ